MLNISKKQALKRWNVLPQNLREQLFSDKNGIAVWEICGERNIDAEKIPMVAITVGDVILGFMRPEDAAKEIQKDLGISTDAANDIAREIDRKIFMPIRGDLDQVFAPPASDGPAAEMIDLRNIGRTSDNPQPATPTPAKMSESRQSAGSEASEPITGNKENNSAEQEEIAPAIIHQKTEFKPAQILKTPLSGLFGLRPRQETIIEPITAQVNLGDKQQATSDKKEPEIASTEKPKVKIVHYTASRAPDVFGNDSDLNTKMHPNDERDTNIRIHSNDINKIRIKENEIIIPSVRDGKEEIKEAPRPGSENNQTDIQESKINSSPVKPASDANQQMHANDERNTNIRMHANNTNEQRIKENARPEENDNQEIKKEELKPHEDVKLEDIPVGDDTIDLRSL